MGKRVVAQERLRMTVIGELVDGVISGLEIKELSFCKDTLKLCPNFSILDGC